MSPCCNTPYLARIEKIRENKDTSSKPASSMQTVPPADSQPNGPTGIDAGNFPTLPRPDMTNVVTPIPGQSGGESNPNDWNTANPSMPSITPIDSLFPDAPSFTVPSNPLLPPGYRETLTYSSLQYLNGFYRTQIGRYVRVDYQTTSNTIESVLGFLTGVGINYLLLQDSIGNITAIDSYSIKTFHVYYNYQGSEII